MRIFTYPIEMDGQKHIAIRTEQFDENCNQLIKKIGRARWSPKDRCWYIPYQKESWARCKDLLKDHEFIIIKNVSDDSKKQLPLSAELQAAWDKMYTLLMVKRYSLNKVKSYSHCFHYFLRACDHKPPEQWNIEDFKQ